MVTFDAYGALFGCNHLGRIAMMPVALCIPFSFSASCNDMFAMLVWATCWLYMHLYTLAYMSMHKSCLLVCHPCFNIMKLWTFDPNLHLSLANTTFCSFSCLFALSLVCLLSYYACHVYHNLCHLRKAMPNFHHESKVTYHQIFAVEIWHFARMP